MSELATQLPSPPAADLERWEHSRMRRRMLYGRWRQDLEVRRTQLFPHVRAKAQGPVDLSGNTFRASCTALAVLYEDPPEVIPPAGSADAEGLVAALDAAGYWDLMIRGQRDCIGMREWAVRFDAEPDATAPLGHRLVIRPVYADMMSADAKASAPDTPARILEPVLRMHRGESVWTWDEWDIRDPDAPRFRILDAGRDADITDEFPSEAAAEYPYRDEDGAPVLPFALYHAERTGYLWDPWEWIELVEGSLNCGVYWGYWGHVLRNASWPQRYAAGVRVPSDTVGEGAETRSRVVTDPSAVLMLEVVGPEEGGGGQPVVGQWQPGADPQTLQDSISSYERRLANFAGLNPADFQRVEGDPRSGYAMKLTADGQAKAQRRYLRAFRRGDLEAIRAAAAVLGAAIGRPIPTRGYDVRHQLVATAEEMAPEQPAQGGSDE